MKGAILLFVFSGLLFAHAVIAQVYIPDANFKNALLSSGVDLNFDGEIDASEAEAATTLLLDSAEIADLTGISAFTNLKTLDCSHNQLTLLDIQALVHLETLHGQDNQLKDIYPPYTANALQYLDLSHNNLTALNTETLVNLTELHIFNNALSWFYPGALPKLKQLRFQHNTLSSVDVSQLPALQVLVGSNNVLYALDLTGNTELTSLDLGGNPFLQALNLTSLSKLKNLYCSQTSQETLDLSRNQQLGILICFDNPFTTLDVSKNINLTYISVGGPNLSSIFMKNGATETLALESSPMLEAICADEAQLPQILAQVSNSGHPSTIVTSACYFLPGADNVNTITATARFDSDNNGCSENDLPANGIKFRLSEGAQYEASLVNPAGNVAFFTGAGEFTVVAELENPEYFTITPPTATATFPLLDKSTQQRNFCMTAKGIHPDLEVIIKSASSARPGFDAAYTILYKNKGNQAFSGSLHLTFDDQHSDFVSTVPSTTSESGSALTWDYANLQPFETRTISVVLNLNSPVETPALNGGDILEFTVTTETPSGDTTPDDNTFILQQEVINSMDPNAITCLEGDRVSPEHIGDYLHYTIEFENFGNGSAINVLVENDINPAQFDITTLQILDVSHTYRSVIKDNKIEFIFADINLAAATGNPKVGGKGSIVYKIKSRASLTPGAQVSNKANIFFDYNAPIETNTATTTYANPVTGIPESEPIPAVVVYPNPTKGSVNLACDRMIKSVDVLDAQGQILQTLYPTDKKTQVDLSNKTKGLYFIRVITTHGSKVEKLVKE